MGSELIEWSASAFVDVDFTPFMPQMLEDVAGPSAWVELTVDHLFLNPHVKLEQGKLRNLKILYWTHKKSSP